MGQIYLIGTSHFDFKGDERLEGLLRKIEPKAIS